MDGWSCTSTYATQGQTLVASLGPTCRYVAQQCAGNATFSAAFAASLAPPAAWDFTPLPGSCPGGRNASRAVTAALEDFCALVDAYVSLPPANQLMIGPWYGDQVCTSGAC
jgi:hypothetical protein